MKAIKSHQVFGKPRDFIVYFFWGEKQMFVDTSNTSWVFWSSVIIHGDFLRIMNRIPCRDDHGSVPPDKKKTRHSQSYKQLRLGTTQRDVSMHKVWNQTLIYRCSIIEFSCHFRFRSAFTNQPGPILKMITYK